MDDLSKVIINQNDRDSKLIQKASNLKSDLQNISSEVSSSEGAKTSLYLQWAKDEAEMFQLKKDIALSDKTGVGAETLKQIQEAKDKIEKLEEDIKVNTKKLRDKRGEFFDWKFLSKMFNFLFNSYGVIDNKLVSSMTEKEKESLFNNSKEIVKQDKSFNNKFNSRWEHEQF